MQEITFHKITSPIYTTNIYDSLKKSLRDIAKMCMNFIRL